MKADVEVIGRPAGPRTIERALGVLDCFSSAASRLRTTSIAQQCDLPVPTAHRILRVLERYGYLVRNSASSEFSLGPAAASFAREDPFTAALRRSAAPALRALCSAAGERAVLARLSASRDHAVEISVADDDPGGGRGAIAWPATARPLHAGASAKVLLAELANDELDAVLSEPLERLASRTVVDPSQLRRELARVRAHGFAEILDELEDGLAAVAMGVRHRGGELAAVVSVTGPAARFAAAARAEAVEALSQTTARVLDGRQPAST
jgi:IclR family acetate operon transcriptional repressor